MSFCIRQLGFGAIISCARCDREVGRFTAQEIISHVASGLQYHCPSCDSKPPDDDDLPTIGGANQARMRKARA